MNIDEIACYRTRAAGRVSTTANRSSATNPPHREKRQMKGEPCRATA